MYELINNVLLKVKEYKGHRYGSRQTGRNSKKTF